MRGKPTGARTVSAVLTQLTMVLGYAVASNWIRSNPADHVSEKQGRPRRVDKEKVLSKAEARRLIEATPDRWRPFIWTALATGMRKSELAGLQWGGRRLRGGADPRSASALPQEVHNAEERARSSRDSPRA